MRQKRVLYNEGILLLMKVAAVIASCEASLGRRASRKHSTKALFIELLYLFVTYTDLSEFKSYNVKMLKDYHDCMSNKSVSALISCRVHKCSDFLQSP